MLRFSKQVGLFAILGFVVCFIEIDNKPIGEHIEQRYQAWAGRLVIERALTAGQQVLRRQMAGLMAYPWGEKLRVKSLRHEERAKDADGSGEDSIDEIDALIQSVSSSTPRRKP